MFKNLEELENVCKSNDKSEFETGAFNIHEDILNIKTTRTILWYLIFTGIVIDSMIRVNLNIAIIDMILPSKISNITMDRSTFSLERKFLDHFQVIFFFFHLYNKHYGHCDII